MSQPPHSKFVSQTNSLYPENNIPTTVFKRVKYDVQNNQRLSVPPRPTIYVDGVPHLQRSGSIGVPQRQSPPFGFHQIRHLHPSYGNNHNQNAAFFRRSRSLGYPGVSTPKIITQAPRSPQIDPEQTPAPPKRKLIASTTDSPVEEIHHAELLMSIGSDRRSPLPGGMSSPLSTKSSELASTASSEPPAGKTVKEYDETYTHHCEECPKRFKCKGNLVRHWKSAHNTEPGIYHCKACDTRFQRTDSFKRHHESQGHIKRMEIVTAREEAERKAKEEADRAAAVQLMVRTLPPISELLKSFPSSK